MLVRRSGDEKLSDKPFDELRLLRDVSRGVLHQMDQDELREVVRQSVLDLQIQLSVLQHPLSREERAQNPGHRVAIWDTDIRHAVERRLRQHGSMPHVLYALSTRGRADREGRRGFRHAGDVLRWMRDEAQYHLADPVLDHGLEPAQAPIDLWWPPTQPPRPDRVISHDLTSREPFSLDRFAASVREAMAGRPKAVAIEPKVVSWTLWGVAGQRDVLASQLGIGVMECLRRVDDIAYLRWAAVTKKIASVSDFAIEAAAMLTHPSPRLVFDVEGQPRSRPRTTPGAR